MHARTPHNITSFCLSYNNLEKCKPTCILAEFVSLLAEQTNINNNNDKIEMKILKIS